MAERQSRRTTPSTRTLPTPKTRKWCVFPGGVVGGHADNFAQNGGYVNPPFVKRQFRDPHADWWDKQERRNYGEPVHEDHDLLGMFSPYEYTWISPGKGALQFAAFVAVFLSVVYVVKVSYPDRPSYPREFEDGLQKELGGAGALRVRMSASLRILQSFVSPADFDTGTSTR